MIDIFVFKKIIERSSIINIIKEEIEIEGALSSRIRASQIILIAIMIYFIHTVYVGRTTNLHK